MLIINNMKFKLGQVVQTKSISEARQEDENFSNEVDKCFARYCNADWSDMEYEDDKIMNDEAIKNGNDRIFATYKTSRGKIYIITEWDRSVTTILFPEDY